MAQGSQNQLFCGAQESEPETAFSHPWSGIPRLLTAQRLLCRGSLGSVQSNFMLPPHPAALALSSLGTPFLPHTCLQCHPLFFLYACHLHSTCFPLVYLVSLQTPILAPCLKHTIPIWPVQVPCHSHSGLRNEPLCLSLFIFKVGVILRAMVPALKRNSFLVLCKTQVSPARDLVTDLLMLLCGRNMLTCGRSTGASDRDQD